jgi:transcription elongation GreA/GreB family factor
VGGDQWHDNFAYESLTQEIRGIDHRLLEKQKTLRNSVLVDPPKSFDKVVIGARVKIIHNGKLMTWDIVGFGESDPSNNMIAYNTRLALLIMGKRKGQVVKEELNGQKTEIEILEIMEGEKNADNS